VDLPLPPPHNYTLEHATREAVGVEMNRLQNIVITLDKVGSVLHEVALFPTAVTCCCCPACKHAVDGCAWCIKVRAVMHHLRAFPRR
jgi:hypothetical protein